MRIPPARLIITAPAFQLVEQVDLVFPLGRRLFGLLADSCCTSEVIVEVVALGTIRQVGGLIPLSLPIGLSLWDLKVTCIARHLIGSVGLSAFVLAGLGTCIRRRRGVRTASPVLVEGPLMLLMGLAVLFLVRIFLLYRCESLPFVHFQTRGRRVL